MTESETLRAYAVPERAAAYDSSMDLMHPNRHPMAEVVGDVLDAQNQAPRTILDLGTGTGFLLSRLLTRFPHARAIAVDGAAVMLDVARERLAPFADRVDFRVGDFRRLETDAGIGTLAPGSIDAVVSCFALHHLSRDEKQHLARSVRGLLSPCGWFLDADIVLCEDPEVERLVQRMRVRGIVRRADGRDPRFVDEVSTRRFLDELEENDHDQPLPVAEDLEIFRRAGFNGVTLFWRHTREVVMGGAK